MAVRLVSGTDGSWALPTPRKWDQGSNMNMIKGEGLMAIGSNDRNRRFGNGVPDWDSNDLAG